MQGAGYVQRTWNINIVTEDSKTRVYLSLVREFNEAEYEKYYLRKKRKKLRRRILFVARTMKYVLPVLVSAVLQGAQPETLS